MYKLSAKLVMSSDVGFGLARNAFSRATRTVVSIEVRFLRRRPMHSDWTLGHPRELRIDPDPPVLLMLLAMVAVTVDRSGDKPKEELLAHNADEPRDATAAVALATAADVAAWTAEEEIELLAEHPFNVEDVDTEVKALFWPLDPNEPRANPFNNGRFGDETETLTEAAAAEAVTGETEKEADELVPKDPPVLEDWDETMTAEFMATAAASASSSHRCNNGFNLHMFLKLRFSASNLLKEFVKKAYFYIAAKFCQSKKTRNFALPRNGGLWEIVSIIFPHC